MAKVSILQINLVELKFQATKMASTLDHHLLKIRDLSIKSAKTMTTTNLKTTKMKTQKQQQGCITQSKRFTESMLIHSLTMSLMKACRSLGKEAFITREYRGCRTGHSHSIRWINTSTTTGDNRLLFQVVVDLEGRLIRVLDRRSRLDSQELILLIFSVAVVQLLTTLIEDKEAQQVKATADQTKEDQEVVDQQVQSSATTTKVHQEQARIQHLLPNRTQITSLVPSSSQIKIIISNIEGLLKNKFKN